MIGLGSVKAETMASNLDATKTGFVQVANDIWWGVKFTTDSHAYLLNSVTVSAEGINPNGTFSLNLYGAGNGMPGSSKVSSLR